MLEKTKENKVIKIRCLIVFGLLLSCFISEASAGLGPINIVDNVKAGRIFNGINSTYVTFSGGALTGCSGNGGYVTSTWAGVNVE